MEDCSYLRKNEKNSYLKLEPSFINHREAIFDLEGQPKVDFEFSWGAMKHEGTLAGYELEVESIVAVGNATVGGSFHESDVVIDVSDTPVPGNEVSQSGDSAPTGLANPNNQPVPPTTEEPKLDRGPRVWTLKSGTQFKGQFRGFKDGRVQISSVGQIKSVHPDALSQADQEYISNF